MAGVDLEQIHRALAGQISEHIDRDTNVSAFPDGSTVFPSITVEPYGQYLDYFGTFGPNGNADMMVRLRIELMAGDLESVCIKMCDYLSVGTGNTSSVVDAIMFDRTLAGFVEDCVALTVEWSADDLTTAFIPVGIILKKQNAEV